jgi:hypothetical protein
MAKSGMIRKTGNYAVKQSFDEKKEENKLKAVRKIAKQDKNRVQRRKNVKISEQQKKEFDAIKYITNMHYDYEVVQMMIDEYVTKLSDSDKRKFNMLSDR